MEQAEPCCYARHSETLDWHAVFKRGEGFVFVPCGSEAVIPDPVVDPLFSPTHVHYKGGLYRVVGFGNVQDDTVEMTLYRSGIGDSWIRVRTMFEENMPDGRPRFAQFKMPECA